MIPRALKLLSNDITQLFLTDLNNMSWNVSEFYFLKLLARYCTMVMGLLNLFQFWFMNCINCNMIVITVLETPFQR